MPFATAAEKAKVQALLANLKLRERQAKATQLARLDWEAGIHSASYYKESQSALYCLIP